MFTDSDFKMVFGLSIVGSIAATTRILVINISYLKTWFKFRTFMEFKPSFYRRYVDDIFVLFESCESASSFHKYMPSKQNIDFSVEQENVGSLSFLDGKICRKIGKFVTSVYRKSAFSGVSPNYESFIPVYQKRRLLHILLHRSFSICFDFKTFHFQIDHLKTILNIKQLRPEFHDLCIK